MLRKKLEISLCIYAVLSQPKLDLYSMYRNTASDFSILNTLLHVWHVKRAVFRDRPEAIYFVYDLINLCW
jgi:hypothetical protein